MFELLLYVEEENFFRECVTTGSYTSAHTARLYLSPADPTADLNDSKNPTASYAANAVALLKEARLEASFPDGLVHTIAFAEHYSFGCGRTQFDWYISKARTFSFPPGPLTYLHRASFAEPKSQQVVPDPPYPPDVYPITGGTPPVTRGSEEGLTFKVRPRLEDCNPRLAQTPHASGMLVGLFDGRVRTLAPNMAPTVYWALVTPDGGEVVGN